MASTYKVLGQSIPAATTSTDLYTVPAATSTVVSTITICNQAGTAGTYRLSVAPAGAALATSQYLAFDVAIAANTTQTLTLGISLATTDKIRVYSSSGSMSFAAYGVELT